jgi:hypothetical protein
LEKLIEGGLGVRGKGEKDQTQVSIDLGGGLQGTQLEQMHRTVCREGKKELILVDAE